jgi:protein-S-isoprenylcysteine O-methyltransferase Ste14
MYVGMAAVLAGHAVRRGPRALLPLAAFVAYIDRLQIQPEEQALRARFGEEYNAYCRRVRRWV